MNTDLPRKGFSRFDFDQIHYRKCLNSYYLQKIMIQFNIYINRIMENKKSLISTQISMLGKYFQTQIRELLLRHNIKDELKNSNLGQIHVSMFEKIFAKVQEDFIPTMKKKIPLFSQILYYEPSIKPFIDCFRIFAAHFEMQLNKLGNSYNFQKSQQTSEVNQLTNMCKKCGNQVEGKKIQLQKYWLGVGKIRDPYNMFTEQFFKIGNEETRERDRNQEESELEQNRKNIKKFLDSITIKIKRRREELIQLMDDIVNFKNNFNSERNSKIIDINKVYDSLGKQFESIGEMIFDKMSNIFWSHITRKVKQFVSVGISADGEDNHKRQILFIKQQHTEVCKKYDDKIRRLSIQLDEVKQNLDKNRKIKATFQQNTDKLKILHQKQIQELQTEIMNLKVNLSENEYQINLLNEENAKLRNINKTLSKGYKFPGKKTRKKIQLEEQEQSAFEFSRKKIQTTKNIEDKNEEKKKKNKKQKPRNSHEIVRDSEKKLIDNIRQDSNLKKSSKSLTKKKKFIIKKQLRTEKTEKSDYVRSKTKQRGYEDQNRSQGPDEQSGNKIKFYQTKKDKIILNLKEHNNKENFNVNRKKQMNRLPILKSEDENILEKKKIEKSFQRITPFKKQEGKRKKILASTLHSFTSKSSQLEQIKENTAQILQKFCEQTFNHLGLCLDQKLLRNQTLKFINRLQNSNEENSFKKNEKNILNKTQIFPATHQLQQQKNLMKITGMSNTKALSLNNTSYRFQKDNKNLKYEKQQLQQLKELKLPQNLSERYFNLEDVKNIYFSIEGAFQHENKRRKIKKYETMESYNPQHLRFILQLNAQMANLHISNKQKYEEIKNFIICPFQTFTQQNYIYICKSLTKNDFKLQHSINQIIKIHEGCSQQNKLCIHLQSFMKKIKQIN